MRPCPNVKLKFHSKRILVFKSQQGAIEVAGYGTLFFGVLYKSAFSNTYLYTASPKVANTRSSVTPIGCIRTTSQQQQVTSLNRGQKLGVGRKSGWKL
ncbi:hypothetical protein MKX07_006435 [Trichoderma sp. CBMAI-0711]|nr:hypothetical protein MKX07_006435 [Trichoderma sp. CBMAI-0711]